MKMKGFVLILALLNCAATVTQACGFPPTLENGYITEGEKKEYSKGDVVIYTCHSGYISGRRVKSMCTGDKWETLRVTCRKKPCGSPGDTANGKFHLEGEDFVYTAKVIYTCNEGYQMASLMDYRICLADGWSNDIPHCEVLTCIPEKTDNNIDIISGMFQPGEPIPYANALRFECNSEHLVLRGEPEVYCTANGTWSKPFPKCKEITCEPPSITHGSVHQQFKKQTYENKDVITFHCDNKYRPAGRSQSTCTKWGWSPEPRCEEITCAIPQNMLYGSIDSYKLESKINEAVTLRCNNGYQTVNKKDHEVVTCTETGEWSVPILCKEITCVIPHNIQYGGIRFYKHEYKINEAVTLRCNNGYQTVNKKEHEEVTCAETGEWSVPLLCKAITCEIDDIPHGRLYPQKRQYRVYEAVTLSCDEGHVTENNKDSKEVTCTKTGQWSITLECKAITCGIDDIPHGRLYPQKRQYKVYEAVTLSCDEGHVTENKTDHEIATCTKTGQWSIPILCKEITCVIPHNIQYGGIRFYKHEYKINEAVTLRCNNGYQTVNKKDLEEVTCAETGEWSVPLLCKEEKCQAPIISDGYFYPNEEYYKIGTLLYYACGPEHKPIIGGTWWKVIQCVNGKWSGDAKCIDKGSCLPPPNVENASKKTKEKEVYNNNDIVEYDCHAAYKPENGSSAICVNGTWELPKCILNKTACGTPPYVQYAVITNKEEKYYEKDEVTYTCTKNTSLEGSKEITCQNGSWAQPPKCLKVAIFRRCEPLKIDNGYRIPEKSTYDPNESVELGCFPPYELKGQRKITCENGHWTETPQCQRNDGTCGPLPTVKDGGIIKGNERSKSVTYGCQRYYVLEGDSTIRCHSGKWSDAPTCIGPCIISKEQLKEKKLRGPQTIYLEHGKSHTFVCIYGYLKDTPYKTQVVKMCEHGQLDVPECVYY